MTNQVAEVTEETAIRLSQEEKLNTCLGVFKLQEGKSVIMRSILYELSEEMNTSMRFVSVNLKQAAKLQRLFKIRLFPSFLIFKQGELVEICSGLISKSELKSCIDKVK